MVMVRHAAVGEDAHLPSGREIVKEGEKALVVGLRNEDRAARQSSIHHVVNSCREGDTQRSASCIHVPTPLSFISLELDTQRVTIPLPPPDGRVQSEKVIRDGLPNGPAS